MSYTYSGHPATGVLGDSVAVAKMSAAGSGTLMGTSLLATAYCPQPASSTAKRELQFDETKPTRNTLCTLAAML